MRAEVGGFLVTACAAVGLGVGDRSRPDPRGAFLALGTPGGSSALPGEEEAPQPRRVHGAPDLARSPPPAEPRLQGKGRTAPPPPSTEVTRCHPARRPLLPHPAARAPPSRPGGRRDGPLAPSPLPAAPFSAPPQGPGKHSPGTALGTRSRPRLGRPGPAAGGGSALQRLARAVPWGGGRGERRPHPGPSRREGPEAARWLSVSGLAWRPRSATAAKFALCAYRAGEGGRRGWAVGETSGEGLRGAEGGMRDGDPDPEPVALARASGSLARAAHRSVWGQGGPIEAGLGPAASPLAREVTGAAGSGGSPPSPCHTTL